MCWLCTYQGEPLGARLNTFIIRHVGIMDPACIAQQVSDFLMLNNPEAKGADPDTMVASARAYIAALNKLMVKRLKTKPEAMTGGASA